MTGFQAHETPDPHPYHKAYRELWTKGWVAPMGDAFIVYETLRMHANHLTQLCNPSHERLMEETGISSVNTLRKRIKKLENLGLVSVIKPATPHSTAEYRIVTAPYLPNFEDQNLIPKENRGSKNDPLEDQKMILRGSKNDPLEDQNLIPNKKKRTKRNNKTHKQEAKQPRASVATSNNSPDDLESSKAAIAILGDKWEGFISHLVEESRTWTAYQSCSNDRARALKIKRVYLPNLFEKGELSNRCYLYLEDCSVSAPQQAQEDGLNPDYEYWDSLYEKDPLEVQNLAGHKIHHFLNWRQKQSAKVH